jgi:hypothetical protein
MAPAINRILLSPTQPQQKLGDPRVTSLLNVYVLPPFAVARLGASDTPVDAFDWVENPATHGAGKTVIRPAVSLRVLPDGSIQTLHALRHPVS